jgi:glycosyltransferase involved in cell wall biosynthesis
MNRVAFIINGDEHSAMGERAREFARRLGARYDVRLAYRSSQKIFSIWKLFSFQVRIRPAVSYVFDMGYSGVFAASLYKLLFRKRLIIETGDAIYALAKTSGMRGPIGLILTWCLERLAYRVADRIIVRGTFHQIWLAERGIVADVIQDGVNTEHFRPQDVAALRREMGLDGVLTVGLVGTSVWSEKLQWCYGWELIETIRLLKDKPVVGVVIGDGSGIARLKQKCQEYGISDRVQFWGRVPYRELPRCLSLLDVCLSTQTNNLAGRVRTTGKLPIYLAAGRYVLASDVGEAALVLPPEMQVSYEGANDTSYPQKLARRIEQLLPEQDELRRESELAEIARRYFDYKTLGERLTEIVRDALAARR